MLEAIPGDKRKTESRFWQEFEGAQPRILGALLTAVAHGMGQPEKHAADLPTDLPRVADSAEWVTRCETAFGWKKGTFLEACRRNARNSANIVLDSDPVAGAVREMMAGETPQPDGSKLWEGLTSNLLKQLRLTIGEAAYRASGMPRAANALSGYLRRATPVLAKIGIVVKQRHVTEGGWVSISIDAPPKPGEPPGADAEKPPATASAESQKAGVEEPRAPVRDIPPVSPQTLPGTSSASSGSSAPSRLRRLTDAPADDPDDTDDLSAKMTAGGGGDISPPNDPSPKGATAPAPTKIRRVF